MTEKRILSSGKPADKKSSMAIEDVHLWEQVKATAEPLKKKSTRYQVKTEPHRKVAQSSEDRFAPSKKLRGRSPSTSERSPGRASHSKTAKSKASSPVNKFNRRQLRQIATGREDIEARLDLHGLRQREAHQALRAFLLRAQSDGKRMVLIITGKGMAGKSNEEALYSDGERGVLKRLVPQWLAEAELRNFVIGYSTANARHGGEGALYVRLRRSRSLKD